MIQRGSAADRLFAIVFVALTALAALPFWLTRILPMQDYPHFLAFVRAFTDLGHPESPFHGTYTTGFPLSPIVLPMLLVRGIAAVTGLETAGRIVWSLYAVGLPLASLHLLSVLRRDRWAVLLVFPLVISYWVIGGFFAFATAAPLFVLGLALAVRWLEAPTRARGVALAIAFCVLHLWHALVFAQMLLCFGVLWLLSRADGAREKARALSPVAPAIALFGLWIASTVRGRSPGRKPPSWPPFFDNATHFFDYVGPIVPEAAGAVAMLALFVAATAITAPRAKSGSFRVASPFAWLALIAAICYLVFPATCFGVEGIHNRQPWVAALLLVFAWSPPRRGASRAIVLGLACAAGLFALVHMSRRFAAFGRETAGASRLLDRLHPHETLLAPMGTGSTVAFPGRPLIALELYATARHGGLPNASFAGYEINFIRYVGGRNPMPGIGTAWLDHPGLTRFDYVLLRGAAAAGVARSKKVAPLARDGEWVLYVVCGSRSRPTC